ncbi:MAG: hypothetical protein IPH75_00530 [bacterium]|nr:hypothetical protein [bacterium]
MKRSAAFRMFVAVMMAVTCCLLISACDKDRPSSSWQVYNRNTRIGDINLNNFEYEIADYVLFARYFLYGEAVFTRDRERQVFNTDVNQDGTPLGVGDLVLTYLTVIGDEPEWYDVYATVNVDVENDEGILSVSQDIGAALLIVEGDATPINYTQHDMDYTFDGVNTRILLYGDVNNGWTEFSGWFVDIGHHKLLSLEMASPKGYPVKIHLYKPALDFISVYPSPFKDSVHLAIGLISSDSAALRVRDALGSVVSDTTIMRDSTHWIQTITWDARAFPDGLYVAELDVRENSIMQSYSKTNIRDNEAE